MGWMLENKYLVLYKYSQNIITVYNDGLLTCSWKPVFLHVDIAGIPTSGVSEKILVLKKIIKN